jgi:hypothetical protein
MIQEWEATNYIYTAGILTRPSLSPEADKTMGTSKFKRNKRILQPSS